ncbi:MAG: HAMP domain-containing histidine kinase [Planctomycetes bacterium]|nr:HAMP domain-containing histidine kinase [Planctomycetota bacterium]
MDPSRRKLYSYVAVVALYLLVFGWWLFFFAHQSEFLLRRVADRGVTVSPEVAEALRTATDENMRMFVFEGAFLGLLLLGSVLLVVRSLQKELSVHRQERNFLSAVTHEFKSPIASAKLYVESLQLGRAEGEKRERYLKHAHQDLDRLQKMVESLLASARMTTTGPDVQVRPLDLVAETREIAAELAHDPQTATAALEVSAQGALLARADSAALRTILRNLVSNAVKYAGPAPRVAIELRRDGRHAVLRVRDWGPGLKGADPRRIFDAFVRGGDENVRTRPGVGLGLYLVSELARAQGGEARALTQPEGGGFAIEVALPAVEKEHAK